LRYLFKRRDWFGLLGFFEARLFWLDELEDVSHELFVDCTIAADQLSKVDNFKLCIGDVETKFTVEIHLSHFDLDADGAFK